MEWDKQMHLIVNYLIVLIMSMFTSVTVAIVTAFTISVLKELFDKFIKKTKFDIGDLVADVSGIMFALVTKLALKGLI